MSKSIGDWNHMTVFQVFTLPQWEIYSPKDGMTIRLFVGEKEFHQVENRFQ